MIVDVDVIGEDEAAADIRAIAKRSADMRPVFQRIRALLIAGHASNFSSRGAFLGDSWPPLAESTREKKGDSAVLQRTGALRASLTGGRGRKSSITRSSVTVGTSDWKAHFHHAGTSTIPARKLVGISETTERAAIELMERFIVHGLA